MTAAGKLEGRTILLGVTGSIAAYKAPLLVRLLVHNGATVQVLTTPAAAHFVTLETLATVSGRPVLSDMFAGGNTWTQHVELGLKADLLLIAPLSAHTLAKVAHGFADNTVAATALTARCPVLLCPAMDHYMYLNAAVRANLDLVQARGIHVMAPEWGALASGLTGTGRLPEPADIFQEVVRTVRLGHSLRGKRALVTAGPTREPLDAVRVLTNRSTGTMGYCLAEALAVRGADVTLVSGPTQLSTPPGVQRINVETAAEMHAAVLDAADRDLVFMAAAVADFAPLVRADNKISKQEAPADVPLRPTTDILKDLGQHKRSGQLLVGFAMETGNGHANALRKLKQKNLDFIVLNYVNQAGAGFGTGTNQVTLFGRDGAHKALPVMPKRAVAEELLKLILRHS